MRGFPSYIHADYALASTVHHLSRGDRLEFGLTYNVWCHWSKRWIIRAKNLPPELSLPNGFNLVGAIPKWHLIGHDQECFVRYSLDHKPFVGRMEGEGPERVWAHLNQHSGSTSEQGPGARTDTINNLAYDWNFEKMIRLTDLLLNRFKEAKRMYIQQEAVHQDLTNSLPPTKVAEWEAISTDPVQAPNGTWTSPLMDPIWTNGRFRETIRVETGQESFTSRAPRKKPGAARWLADGIELEHGMRKVHDEAKCLGLNPTPRRAESLEKSHIKLRNQIVAFRKRASQYTGALADQEPDHPDRIPPPDDEPEHWDLGLPSSFDPATLLATGLSSLADLEKELRRGMCGNSLASTRHDLGARAFAINYKNQHVHGEAAVTRSEAVLRAHSAKIANTRWRYDNSRNALLRLGPSDLDLRRYREMTDGDLRTLKSYLEEVSRGIGQGYNGISWVWCSDAVPHSNEWQINALKTEWFRSRERYMRWKEQLVLLKREMTMTIRTFKTWEKLWRSRAI
ncbi:hypothetical protein FRC08_008109 [Ceratobasidium sp. 394]|nr:hypothetical protein FRC08_008109 [Ceratobasidium sp. 394]